MSAQVPTRNKHGHDKFFRNRLLAATREQVSSYVDSLDKEADQIRAESFRLAWHLRGGGTYEDVMNMSPQERRLVSELAKENIETTKKSNLPWF